MNIREDIKNLKEAQDLLWMIQNDPQTICEQYWVEPDDLILIEEELMDKINAIEENNIRWFIENKCEVINDYNMNIEWIKTEIARLQDIMEKYTKKMEKAKDSIDWIMKATNTDKIDTKLNCISYRKSEAVLIQDEAMIPTEYWKEKVTKSVDKTMIKEAIKSWKEVAWAVIEERQNLQIK